MTADDATPIAEWVKKGGMLVIMENDPTHADHRTSRYSRRTFRDAFQQRARNTVDGNKFEMGRIDVSGGGPIFQAPHVFFMKEICTITLKQPAKAIWVDKGDVLMAEAQLWQR